MNENGISLEEKESGQSCESGSTSDSKLGIEERRNKNSEKKARNFDYEEIFQKSLENAILRNTEREIDNKNSNEVVEECASTEFGGLSIRSQRTAGFSEKRQPGSSQSSDLSEERDQDTESDDDYAVPLPSYLVIDKHIEDTDKNLLEVNEQDTNDINEEDFVDFGERVPITQLIPTSCEALLKPSKKLISALAFDQQGTRFASGSFDYAVNLFDFQQMDVSLRPSRELTPCESHIINSLAFSSNGEYLLVASGHAQIRILDRHGKQWAETVRGDQYLVDLSNTKGHTGSVNACCWHPLIKTEFLSCADDGTLRIWSIDDYKDITRCINKQRNVIKTKNAGGKRAIPTTCAFSRDGKLVAAGCNDGSIQIWKHGTIFVTTTYLNRNAHSASICCLQFSSNNEDLVSRSLDGTLKIWELKKFKKPKAVKENLDTDFIGTDCGFSPHAEFVFTCVSEETAEGWSGALLFFDSTSLDLVYQINYPTAGCTRAVWQPKINQLLVGLNDGTLRLYYDPVNSARGALLCISRPLRRARQKEIIREEMVLSPLALEMFQPRGEEGEEKEVTAWRLKKYLRMQDNKLRPEFRKPADMPMSGPSSGGRVAASGGTLHSYIAKQEGTKRNRDFLADNDVRASILRHAQEAEKNPYYVAKAYLKNQPVTIFQEKTTAPEEEEPDNELHPIYKIPRTQ